MTNKLLEAKNLEVFYGDFQALFGVDIHIEKEEILALLGSNGAGKTTTLRTISGLLKPKRGKILWNGNDITSLPAYKRVELGIAHVPEGRGIFPKLTVFENLKVASLIPRAKKKFYDSLEVVYNLFPRLKERTNQLAMTLSGGEQQMLAIAKAITQRPILLMMDEPSLGLAPKLATEILHLIPKLRDELKVTVLLVEQNVLLSLKVAERGYVLETGRIALKGTSEELLNNPKIKSVYLGI